MSQTKKVLIVVLPALLLIGLALRADAQVAPTPSLPVLDASTTTDTSTSTASSTLPVIIASSTPASPTGPYLVLGTYTGNFGASIAIQGGGYEANEPITIDFGGTTSTSTTNANGNFATSVLVPPTAIGNTPITATGGYSGTMAQTVFISLGAATTTPSTTTPAVPSPISTTVSSTTGPLLPILGIGTTTLASTVPSAPAVPSSTTSTTVMWPPLSPLKPAVIQIAADGSLLLRGTVESVGTSTLVVRSWGGDWYVTVGSGAGVDPNGLSAIVPGDYIGLLGYITTAASTSITATYIRDWTRG